MKFFIDTANLTEIKEAQDLGVLDGVTTNPSLMAKEGITGEQNIIDHYKKICQVVDDNVSAEVISVDFKGMIEEGLKLAALDKKIVVKVPLIKEGIKATKYLTEKGIRVNCTLVFTAGQALLAAKAGAYLVSPFIGRLDDAGHNGADLIKQIVQIYRNYNYKTWVLAASIRHVPHIIQCAEAGSDVITAPFKALMGLLQHPLTDKGLAQFLADHEKVKQKF
ncbi:MAG: fructose-6-phosphate aldolase [Bacteroidetes bacterium RIFCSPLOWO2_02_FULL_36_8]|nr:MAG: fructose-6-phosphate aldolase [Bacteroidetes bacterium RIFCSPLOWO2_02_FULL_36_8]OFY69901.1 MAG: fructose-6-phosphate aldolase [Bacteroidetes bacterium RIFCSPLOWO2_12_FULL_37_12]